MTTDFSRSDVLCASLVDLDRYPLLDQAGASMAALLVEAQYELRKDWLVRVAHLHPP